ncbi:MAG: hypothetical protein HWN69_06505 [Desulfobacterales bacterium]|nr:hypothetical protein [Desulfobacterales bacterium]
MPESAIPGSVRHFLLILIVVNLCLAGCAYRREIPVAEPLKALNIKTLLVMPFDAAAERYEIGTNIRCPMCGAVFPAGPVVPDADSYMTRQLLTFLRAETMYTLIPPGQGARIRYKILSESLHLSERDLVLETGRKLKADAVVSGTIYRFRERVGTDFSVETPASVAFGIHLIRVDDGRLIWVGHSDETQKSLSENLFKLSAFIKSGGAWLTAEELAGSELNRVMATFPVP